MSVVLALLSGGFVGFSLGLIGGGGSILATPLLIYVVGVGQPHVAIGTGALAVAVSAMANFSGHWRAGNVRWGNALVFAAFGVVGALGGSTLGKAFDGERLLFLFALLMIAVGLLMLRSGERNGSGRAAAGAPSAPAFTPRLAAVALAVGGASGFFGIGGGFLIVPGLVFATG
ncbi:MAG: sulfite exporter TauE/SafE family protein, partial [Methylobacteriaceae bacterium]